MKEIWIQVDDYKGLYEVSNFGRVKSLPKSGSGGSMSEKIMSDYDNSKGYRYITLTKNKKRNNHYVHILVAKAFHPNPSSFQQVNHKDTNKTNNAAINLEWCDRFGNMRHAYANGLIPVGERNHLSKITETEVLEIRRLRRDGVMPKALSEKFNISKAQVHRIVNRELWKHVA